MSERNAGLSYLQRAVNLFEVSQEFCPPYNTSQTLLPGFGHQIYPASDIFEFRDYHLERSRRGLRIMPGTHNRT